MAIVKAIYIFFLVFFAIQKIVEAGEAVKKRDFKAEIWHTIGAVMSMVVSIWLFKI